MILLSKNMNLIQLNFPEWYNGMEKLVIPQPEYHISLILKKIRPIISDLYENDTEKGGRPNRNPVLMIKILLLQRWYRLLTSSPPKEPEVPDSTIRRQEQDSMAE